jgi:CelD/BcsL family acetyltransferase involved in cellulose biosynthesis
LTAGISIAQEDFESLKIYYANPDSGLNWNLVFTLPEFLKLWWQNFSSGAELYLASVKQNDQIIGIAPLQIRDSIASIVGSVNVCDYQDFIVVPGLEKDFFNAVLDDLRRRGVTKLHLETVRPDSAAVTHLMPLARARRYQIDYRQVDVSSDILLPPSWGKYLKSLDGKQRHELKRKMRNLLDIGDVNYRAIDENFAIPVAIDTFLKLFPEARTDKAEFMTPAMQTFFRSLAEALAKINVIRFGSLETGRKSMAMVMYFDYRNDIYLYNSAYDPDYKSLSVGIISKANCIQNSIEKSKVRFDFLKGSEQYKYYLGGHEIPLYAYEVSIR